MNVSYTALCINLQGMKMLIKEGSIGEIINLIRESISKRDGREEHLDADKEILIAGRDSSCVCGVSSAINNILNDSALFQNRQTHA